MSDLFSSAASTSPDSYDASAIEVLEGLEPVRRRPGMYIGGTDARALHHLAAEVIDNSMDEAVAGFANRIEVTLDTGNFLENMYEQVQRVAPHAILVQAKTYFGGGEWYTLDIDYARVGRILRAAG